jgi:hypothetical protein
MTETPAGSDARRELMQRHAAARATRDAAPLGSDAFRAAAEEVARIEIEIASREEPPMEHLPADTQPPSESDSPSR